MLEENAPKNFEKNLRRREAFKKKMYIAVKSLRFYQSFKRNWFPNFEYLSEIGATAIFKWCEFVITTKRILW